MMKDLKKHARIYNYLVSATSIKSYKPMDSYSKQDLIKVYIEQAKKDLETLKRIEE